MWKLYFLGMTGYFNALWESGTKKIFSESMEIFVVLYYPSLVSLDSFPVLYFIGQTPGTGWQTQG